MEISPIDYIILPTYANKLDYGCIWNGFENEKNQEFDAYDYEVKWSILALYGDKKDQSFVT